jgi:uncharacterized protein
MKKVFADADYLIALLNPREQLHTKAKSVSQNLGTVRMVTSQMVLVEMLAFYADKGSALREAAASVASNFSADPNATVIPQTSLQFQEALSHYRQRGDKDWSVTDCASFLLMREAGISEALTHDVHFQQAGFIALLRDSEAGA